MHCHEFEQRLNDQLDDRQNPAADPRLAAHAAGCEPCRQLLADHSTLLFGLSQLKAPALHRDFSRRVIAAAAPTLPLIAPRRSARRALSALAAALSSAAAMLLAISLAWYARSRDTALDDNTDVATPLIGRLGSPSPGFAIAQPPARPRKSTQRETTAISSADLFLEAPRLPARFYAYRESIDELAVSFPVATFRLDEMEHLAPGFRPLRASFTTIWETFCRTIPTALDDASPPQRGPTSLWSLELARIA